MLTRLILVAPVALVTACAGEPAVTTASADRVDLAVERGDWYAERFAQGRSVYEQSCASCHDRGASAAPAIGVREDWDHRSRLWTAVLAEHAKAGYLAMPAKGGAPGLSDEQVGAAAEYILTVTYPDLPVD